MKECENINIINTNKINLINNNTSKHFTPDKREKYDIYIPLVKDDDDDDDDDGEETINITKNNNSRKTKIKNINSAR